MHAKSKKVDFDALSDFVKPFEAAGRTPSAALLIWFLETLYRLDETEAQDAVCDRKHDAGIDALVVSDSSNEIVVFQAKRKEKLPATLGDTDLKAFFGALAQLKSETSVNKLVSSTKNDELKKLLEAGEVAKKIGAGYRVRPIFVSNVAANADAHNYLEHAEPKIELWDLERLGPVLQQLTKEWFVDEKVSVRVDPKRLVHMGPKSSPSLIYAAVSALELVKLPGIDDARIFAQNVRLGLGNTRVNSEIVASVKNKKEHGEFLTFHNGLTVVAKEIGVRGGTITLSGLSVCNGCQSLVAFYDNRKHLTKDLEVLVRVVKVGNDRKLPELIAYRTNNQNPISLRDLNSNDSAQIRLKREFDALYGAYSMYSIKRGERLRSTDIKNEDAGRMLLSLYVREPTSAHQKYKIFGELEGKIFSIDTTAARIRFAQLLYDRVLESKGKIKSERLRKYGLTAFVVLYLVGELLRESNSGRELLRDPSSYLRSSLRPDADEAGLLLKIQALVEHAIVELNYFVKDSGGETYDYKSEFKSAKAVEVIRNSALKAYDKDIASGRASEFVLQSADVVSRPRQARSKR